MAAANHPRGEIELEPMIGQKQPNVPQLLALADANVRNGFVRKVYGILGTQLLATTLIAGSITVHGKAWVLKSPALVSGLVQSSSLVSLLVMLVFMCCPDTIRRSPANYGLLAVFTAAEGVLVGFVCIQYTMGSVLGCFGLTALVVIGLTAYACCSKTDFTTFGPYLFCLMLVMCGTGLMMGLMAMMGLASTALFGGMQLVYSVGGALLFSMYIVYDTQLILGGNHERQFSVDDYAMAAVSLYLDIIQLFLMLLRLFGKQDNGI